MGDFFCCFRWSMGRKKVGGPFFPALGRLKTVIRGGGPDFAILHAAGDVPSNQTTLVTTGVICRSVTKVYVPSLLMGLRNSIPPMRSGGGGWSL